MIKKAFFKTTIFNNLLSPWIQRNYAFKKIKINIEVDLKNIFLLIMMIYINKLILLIMKLEKDYKILIIGDPIIII